MKGFRSKDFAALKNKRDRTKDIQCPFGCKDKKGNFLVFSTDLMLEWHIDAVHDEGE